MLEGFSKSLSKLSSGPASYPAKRGHGCYRGAAVASLRLRAPPATLTIHPPPLTVPLTRFR